MRSWLVWQQHMHDAARLRGDKVVARSNQVVTPALDEAHPRDHAEVAHKPRRRVGGQEVLLRERGRPADAKEEVGGGAEAQADDVAQREVRHEGVVEWSGRADNGKLER